MKKFNLVIIIGIILVFAVPFFYNYDKFPFSNYPMYANPSYYTETSVVLCNEESVKTNYFLNPIMPATALYLSKKYDRTKKKSSIQYMDIVETWYKVFRKKDNAMLRLVTYKLDTNKYHSLILNGYSERQIRELSEFNPCN